MSIQNSINFISTVGNNYKFRSELNGLKPDEFLKSIKEYGFDFTPDEFEESINLIHVKCQFEEQAERLFEVVTWYRILTSQN